MSVSLERGLADFAAQIDTPIATFFSSCVNCGMCAHACLFYTETGDPRYTPIYKLMPLRRSWEQNYTFWGKLSKVLGLTKPISDDELAEWEDLIYDSCTMCGRCSLVCPVGNDIAYMIQRIREGMVASGHAPQGLVDATKRAITTGSPMGVKLPALQAQIGHVEQEIGFQIPMDREGAEYLAILSSMEIINFPEYLSAIARIFKQAGVSWTLCSEAFEATNSGHQIGQSDLAAELTSRIVAGAERLKVKAVISPECGHAWVALRWDGPTRIGRVYPFKVVHILEVLDELRAQGRLRTEGKDDARLTFHDPCQIVRRGGLVHPQRNLLNMVASDFVEMQEPGAMNWCCGGGGGVSTNERAEPLRLKAFQRKKSQLEGLGVEKLVTACANCRLVIEEGIEEYNMDLPVVGLTETLAEYLLEQQPPAPKE
jgi:Fe-S oxidoreductase